jgi:hypothetical protein
MSGIQILSKIRQLPAYQETPIVILSRLDKERATPAGKKGELSVSARDFFTALRCSIKPRNKRDTLDILADQFEKAERGERDSNVSFEAFGFVHKTSCECI